MSEVHVRKVGSVIYPELSYKLTGIFFEVQRELGRFAKEKQYSNLLEQKFKEYNIKYRKEYFSSETRNRVDYIVEDRILLELKAVPYVKKEFYYQVQRYLKDLNLKLGMTVNFRNEYLKPYRIINFNS